MRLFKIACVLVLVFSIFQNSGYGKEPEIKPIAKNGVIDLKTCDLLVDGPIALEGEWTFYWEQLLTPLDFESHPQPKKSAYVHVPEYWNEYNVKDMEIGSDGYATFRLIVANVKPNQLVAFDISSINTAYTLFVNGKIIARCGIVNKIRATSIPHECPEKPYVYLDRDALDFVVQVSNYHHSKGGFWHGITIGSLNDILSISAQRIALDMFLIGSILIMGLYHLGLFSLRRKEQSTLFFGLSCLFIALRTSFHNSEYFFYLFPDFDWQIYLKLDYATLYVPSITFCLFFQRLYRQEFSKTILKIIISCCVVFGIVTIVTPTHIFSQTLPLFQIVIVLSCFYVTYVMILASLRKREGANVLLAGSLILIFAIINDVLHARAMINTLYISSSGLFAFIFSQAYVISKRFSYVFSTIETLSMKLEQQVNDQTAAIRDLLDNTGQGIFSFDKNLKIQKYASKVTQSIFGKTITGEHAAKLMFPEKSNVIEGYIDVVFESGGKLRLVKDVLPVELKRDNQFFDVSYRWISPGKTTSGRIMVILTDVTVKRKLEKMLEKDEQRNQRIIRIAIDRYGFLRFYNEIQDQLNYIRETLKDNPSDLTIDELSRMFHTIKGGTAGYAFHAVSHLAHETESMLEEIKTGNGILTKDIISELNNQLDRLQALFKEKLQEVGDLVPKELLKESRISFYTISEEKVRDVEQLVLDQLNDNIDLKNAINNLRKQPMTNLMKKLASDAKDLAFEMGKQVDVHYSGEKTRIIHTPFEKLFFNLIHLVRNAIDHGIESPAVRKEAGKKETGELNIEVSIEKGNLKMIFADDGAGIDVLTTKQKALEKQIISQDQFDSLSDSEALNLIFKPNFSTKSKLTKMSGRGIGMSAIFTSVEKLGGTISVTSQLNRGTSFTILIPMAFY
ncbi:Hpt domain-containing protein [bacterium]|nr:Hpt domain-containing protein [bacterium]